MNKNPKEIKLLKTQIWITAIALASLIIASQFFHYFNYEKEKQEMRKILLLALNDTLNIKKVNEELPNITIIANKIVEDSLNRRIVETLDSLEIMEEKLKFVQENSNTSVDIIVSIADSIAFYRKETETLKHKIEDIGIENEILLKKERDNNAILKQNILIYEKRLKSLHPVNLEVSTFSDGYDNNNIITTTTKAKKIQEIEVRFLLNRELDRDEESVQINLMRNNKTLMQFKSIKGQNKTVKRTFKIIPAIKLEPGRYKITIYHDYSKYDINHYEIGHHYIDLD